MTIFRMQKGTKAKSLVVLSVFFVVLFLNFSINVFRTLKEDSFHNFDLFSESLVYGKIARSLKSGVMSEGGFTGNNHSEEKIVGKILNRTYTEQLSYLLEETETPGNYFAYTSQSGGQAIFYSLVCKVSPLDARMNFRLVKLINAFLITLVLSLFGGWVYRNFGTVTTFTLLVLLVASPWLLKFGHSLWWSLWAFYLPFIVMLLMLEKRFTRTNGSSPSDATILLALYIAVFIKCFFNGFEFITSTLLALMCPVLYYFVAARKTFIDFIIFSFKVAVVSVLAVLSEMLVMLVQFKIYAGSFAAGVQHILFSYSKRTDYDPGDPTLSDVSLSTVLKWYFGGDIFESNGWGLNVPVYFWILITLVIAGAIVYYLLAKKGCEPTYMNRAKALLASILFSILSPLSWFIIFKQHSVGHTHLDYIVWYMPFLLLGFVALGQLITYGNKKFSKIP